MPMNPEFQKRSRALVFLNEPAMTQALYFALHTSDPTKEKDKTVTDENGRITKDRGQGPVRRSGDPNTDANLLGQTKTAAEREREQEEQDRQRGDRGYQGEMHSDKPDTHAAPGWDQLAQKADTQEDRPGYAEEQRQEQDRIAHDGERGSLYTKMEAALRGEDVGEDGGDPNKDVGNTSQGLTEKGLTGEAPTAAQLAGGHWQGGQGMDTNRQGGHQVLGPDGKPTNVGAQTPPGHTEQGNIPKPTDLSDGFAEGGSTERVDERHGPERTKVDAHERGPEHAQDHDRTPTGAGMAKAYPGVAGAVGGAQRPPGYDKAADVRDDALAIGPRDRPVKDDDNGNSQTAAEVTYTGYERRAVPRTAVSFKVEEDGKIVLATDINFPAGAGGAVEATHWSLGLGSMGKSLIVASGKLPEPIKTGMGIIPVLKAGTVLLEAGEG